MVANESFRVMQVTETCMTVKCRTDFPSRKKRVTTNFQCLRTGKRLRDKNLDRKFWFTRLAVETMGSHPVFLKNYYNDGDFSLGSRTE